MTEVSHRQYRALVVDDEVVARRMLAFAIGQRGFQCDHAVDGAQAMELLKSRTYDLVVTDLAMPNIHGHSLIVELLSGNPRPAIMVHSAIDDPRLKTDLLARGVDEIVYKPADYASVAARAKALVQSRLPSASKPTADVGPAG
jgi:DNA-binding response OmpR family regulator